MDKYGLIGFPLGHSFSYKYFNQKFADEGIDAVYENYEIDQVEKVKDIIEQTPNLRGLNVTIPYKEQVIPLLDDLSPEAKAIGAVNVIRIERAGKKVKLKGYNSDITGFTKSIEPMLEPYHRKALILGTGGASKAINHGLLSLGLQTTFVSRRKRDGMFTYDELTDETMQDYKVIVNCTPVGMYPHVDECPQLPYEAMNTRTLLYDLVYNPDQTLFMRKGAAHGACTKNGLEMLLLQAFASWEFWNQ